jgi:hypothetical protein
MLAGLVAGVWVQPASAAEGAAIRRAVVQVDDEALTIEVVVNARYLQSLRGPIRLVVTLPAGTVGTLIEADQGFTDFGWSVSFRRGRDVGVGTVAVTVLSRQRGVATEVDMSSEFGWAYGVPGTVNTTSIVEFYPSTSGLPGPVAVHSGALHA